MGTRSLTILKDAGQEEYDGEIAVLYRQFDGYPRVQGAQILECLGGKTVVNGYNADDQINGAGCMAIQLISWLRLENSQRFNMHTKEYDEQPLNAPSQFDLMPPGTRDVGEDYTYTLTCPARVDWTEVQIDDKLHLKVESRRELIYDGPLDDFDPEEYGREDSENEEE
jgi:hypothetical protein